MESETKPNKAHHENGQKEPLDPAKIAPTNPCSTMTSWAADYGLKSRIPGEHMEIKSSLF
jgi:hypothetical protein